MPSNNEYNLKLNLAHPIVIEQCSYKILTSKIEIKLKKQDDIRWLTLEGKEVAQYAEKLLKGKCIINLLFYRKMRYKCQIKNLIINKHR